MQKIAIFIFSILFISCGEQKTSHLSPKGIIDKTNDYRNSNKGWTSLNNKERVEGYTRIGDSIYGGELTCDVKPLTGIDIKTFKVLPGTLYAKDAKHVYYPLAITCVDYTDCGVCYYAKVLMEKANSSTFEYLGKDYATDGKNVFYRGELIPNADGQTFKIIDGPKFFYFATDKNNVYRHSEVFENANPLTFYYDKNDSRNVDNEFAPKYIIGDNDNEWEFIPPSTINKVAKK